MDKIKFDIDLEAINKAQEMNIKAFKDINSVALKNISEAISCISKLNTGIFKMQENYTEISSLFSGLKNSITQLNLSTIESMKGVTESMSELSDILTFNASTYLKDVKIEGFADSIKGLQDVIRPIETWNLTSESIKAWNKQIQSLIGAIPNEDYKILLKDTGYTKEDVIGDFSLISEELGSNHRFYQKEKNVIHFNPKEEREQLENNFAKKYPAAYIFLVLLWLFFDALGKVEVTNNLILPFIQNVSVTIEGNQNKYFIKEEKARVYESSSCRSKVLDIVYYGEEVEEIKDIKMWLKVSYVNEDGAECIGWIAKRNLMTYKDWKFNSDDLYNIE